MKPTSEIIQSRLEWGRQLARQSRLRKTNAFDRVLTLLAEAELPLTWTQICEMEQIQKQFDPATIFRILEKMERVGIGRRMVFRERASYYFLAIPGERHEYLVCTQCGTIVKVDVQYSLSELAQQVETKTGFSKVQPHLAFFGTCPKCSPPTTLTA